MHKHPTLQRRDEKEDNDEKHDRMNLVEEPSVTKDEVHKALREMRMGKSVEGWGWKEDLKVRTRRKSGKKNWEKIWYGVKEALKEMMSKSGKGEKDKKKRKLWKKWEEVKKERTEKKEDIKKRKLWKDWEDVNQKKMLGKEHRKWLRWQKQCEQKHVEGWRVEDDGTGGRAEWDERARWQGGEKGEGVSNKSAIRWQGMNWRQEVINVVNNTITRKGKTRDKNV